MIGRYRHLLTCAVLLCATGVLVAQGPPGRDRDNPPPGHGGMPPGQAKKAERGLPPGLAKKYFRDADRDRFYRHYRSDADHWRGRHRPAFVPGGYIARVYDVRPVPEDYWEGEVPPPPPGYQYGYCRGYVVAYNPATRMIADVLDLINTARYR